MAIITFGQVNIALNTSSNQQNVLGNNNVQAIGIGSVGDIRMMRCDLGLQEFHSVMGGLNKCTNHYNARHSAVTGITVGQRKSGN